MTQEDAKAMFSTPSSATEFAFVLVGRESQGIGRYLPSIVGDLRLGL